MTREASPEPFTQAKELLALSQKEGQAYHIAKCGRDRPLMGQHSHGKLLLACRATLKSPDDVIWLDDQHYGHSVSISTTRKKGPRVHIPRRLLQDYIANNGFDPAEKAILWSKFDYSKTHTVYGRMQSKKRKKRKRPAKV